VCFYGPSSSRQFPPPPNSDPNSLFFSYASFFAFLGTSPHFTKKLVNDFRLPLFFLGRLRISFFLRSRAVLFFSLPTAPRKSYCFPFNIFFICSRPLFGQPAFLRAYRLFRFTGLSYCPIFPLTPKPPTCFPPSFSPPSCLTSMAAFGFDPVVFNLRRQSPSPPPEGMQVMRFSLSAGRF